MDGNVIPPECGRRIDVDSPLHLARGWQPMAMQQHGGKDHNKPPPRPRPPSVLPEGSKIPPSPGARTGTPGHPTPSVLPAGKKVPFNAPRKPQEPQNGEKQ